MVEDHRGKYRYGQSTYVDSILCLCYFRAFQKKSPSGIRTAKTDVELVTRRLNQAKADYEVRYAKGKS